MRKPPLDPRSRAAACWSSPRPLLSLQVLEPRLWRGWAEKEGTDCRREGTEQGGREGGREEREGREGRRGEWRGCRRARSPEGTVATRRAHPRRLATSVRPYAGRTHTGCGHLCPAPARAGPFKKVGEGSSTRFRPPPSPTQPLSSNLWLTQPLTVPTVLAPDGETGLAPTPESPFSPRKISPWSLGSKVERVTEREIGTQRYR